MKIFNSGNRTYATAFGPVSARSNKEVPEEFSEEAKRLIRMYPRELSDGGPGTAEVASAKKEVANKDARIAELEGQLAKLQQLVATGSDAESAEKIVALETAVKEADEIMAEQKKKIADLTKRLKTATTGS